jgi:hypothetical protein
MKSALRLLRPELGRTATHWKNFTWRRKSFALPGMSESLFASAIRHLNPKLLDLCSPRKSEMKKSVVLFVKMLYNNGVNNKRASLARDSHPG